MAQIERKPRDEYAARGRAEAREEVAVRRVTNLIDRLEYFSLVTENG